MASDRPNPRFAFTLIELVVVVVIIALLSSLAVMSFGGTMDRYALNRAAETVQSFDSRARRDARTSRTAVTGTIERRRDTFRLGQGRQAPEFHLPRAVNIADIRVDRRAVSAAEVQLQFNSDGVSPSYAVQLQRGESSLWMVVLGVSGQVVTLQSEREVNAILAL